MAVFSALRTCTRRLVTMLAVAPIKDELKDERRQVAFTRGELVIGPVWELQPSRGSKSGRIVEDKVF